MRKIVILILALISTPVFANVPTRQYTYNSGSVIDPVAVNANENALYSYLQTGVDTYKAGSITTAALSNTSGITYSQLNLTGSLQGSDVNTGSTFTFGGLIVGSVHQGDVLYDNGTSFVRLTPGTSGQVLQTQGAGANPQWAMPSGQLGAWNVSGTGSYIGPVSTDGFAIGWGAISGGATLMIKTGTCPTPSQVTSQVYSTATGAQGSVFSPVRKGECYKFDTSGGGTYSASFFMSLGS
jgi:hypothetical protein